MWRMHCQPLVESTPSAEALERVLGDYPGVQPTHTVATFRW